MLLVVGVLLVLGIAGYAAYRSPLVRSWFGRDLMESEMAEFDTETLIGKPAQLVVVHEHKEGQVYANIAACLPHKSPDGSGLKPSGTFRLMGPFCVSASRPAPLHDVPVSVTLMGPFCARA